LAVADSDGTTARRAGTLSAERVADVLLAVGSDSAGKGISEVARDTGLSLAVVHRILQSLTVRDLIKQSPETHAYCAGPALLAVGLQLVQNSDVRRIARPVLEWLQRETGETATLSLLSGYRRFYADQVVSEHEMRLSVELGRNYGLHAGASSRAILAYLDESARRHVLSSEPAAGGPAVIRDPAELQASLARVLTDGVAFSREEREVGAAGLAAPIFGPDGRVVGAISVCGPVHRLHDEALARFTPTVRRGSEQISADLQHAALDPAHIVHRPSTP
jgi:DNA-binding IclR family transcriptional regulator